MFSERIIIMAKKQTNTREKILKTSGKLLSQRGYYGVSMSNIAKEMNFTKASLYYHFKSKDALVEELMKGSITDLKKELQLSVEKSKLPSDIVFNIVKTILDFKINHPEISLLVSMGITTDKKVPILELMTELRTDLIKFIRELFSGADLLRRFTYKAVFSFTTTILGFVLSPLHSGDRSSKKLANDFTSFLLSGSESNIK